MYRGGWGVNGVNLDHLQCCNLDADVTDLDAYSKQAEASLESSAAEVARLSGALEGVSVMVLGVG